MKKVFAYLRVSDISQVKGDGFTRQEEACQDYASSHDMRIIQVFKEPWTGTDYDRPVLAALMVSLEKNHHGVKTVIIEKLDRLARDLMIQEGIVSKFQTKGFDLISTIEGADLLSSEPSRKFIRQVFGAVAELDKAWTVARLRAARDRIRAETGRCEGRTQYIDTDDGLKLIQYIKSLHEKPDVGKRKTLQQIANQLNAEGIKTISGKTWSLHRVRDIILDL